jgi:hypothetical protein
MNEVVITLFLCIAGAQGPCTEERRIEIPAVEEPRTPTACMMMVQQAARDYIEAHPKATLKMGSCAISKGLDT